LQISKHSLGSKKILLVVGGVRKIKYEIKNYDEGERSREGKEFSELSGYSSLNQPSLRGCGLSSSHLVVSNEIDVSSQVLSLALISACNDIFFLPRSSIQLTFSYLTPGSESCFST
jgi:hypothetical protein